MLQFVRQHKSMSVILINALVVLMVLCFGVPRSNVNEQYSWNEQAEIIKTDSVFNGTTFSREISQVIVTGLSRGSYEVVIVMEDPVDNDVLQIKGGCEISSVYSNTVSCVLSQYTNEYVIPFENYEKDNTISLYHYQQEDNLASESQIVQISLRSTTWMQWQYIAATLLLLAILDTVILCWRRLSKRKWAVILAAAAFASIPLFTGKIFYGHDTLFHVTRIEGLKAALLAGQFPARVSAAQYNEYGYISSALYPELFLYLPALLRLLNVSVPTTYCIFWGLMHVLTAYVSWESFYGLTKKENSAYIGCVLYTLFPFRLISVYLRGAFGEALAMSFFPLIAWGVYEIFYGDRKKWPIALMGYCGVLQSHILTTATTLIFTVIWGFLNIRTLFREKRRIGTVLLLAGSAFFLNMWFLIPFLMLYQLPLWVKYMKSDFLDHVLYLRQLFDVILHGAGNSLPLSEGIHAEMPFGIGLGLLIGLGVVIAMLLKKKIRFKGVGYGIIGMLMASMFLYWTTTVYFPWDTINNLFPAASAFISNLPWRRLGTAGLFLTVAVILAVGQIAETKWKRYSLILMTAGTLLSAGSYLVSYVYSNEPVITCNEDLGAGFEDELYLYYGTDIQGLKERGNVLRVSSDEVAIIDYSKLFTNVDVSLKNASGSEQWVEIPLNYYPGYVAYDEDGNACMVAGGDNNVIRITIPARETVRMHVAYEECTMYGLATLGSMGFFVVFIVLLVLRKNRCGLVQCQSIEK